MALFPWTQYDFPNVSNYDSDLREVLHYWEQLRDMYAEILADIATLAGRQDSVEAEFAQVQTEFAALSRKVDGLFDDMYAAINEGVNEKVGTALAGIRQEIANLHAMDARIIGMIENFDDNTKLYVTAKILEATRPIEKELEAIRKEISELQFELPDIMNPAKGYRTPLYDVIINMWDALRYAGATCRDWRIASKTAGELDGMNKTALEWDLYGKHYLIKRNVYRNPMSGLLSNPGTIFQALAEFHRNALTAAEYAALDLTAAEYAAYELTAYEYDFNGKELLST